MQKVRETRPAGERRRHLTVIYNPVSGSGTAKRIVNHMVGCSPLQFLINWCQKKRKKKEIRVTGSYRFLCFGREDSEIIRKLTSCVLIAFTQVLPILCLAEVAFDVVETQ